MLSSSPRHRPQAYRVAARDQRSYVVDHSTDPSRLYRGVLRLVHDPARRQAGAWRSLPNARHQGR
jgi:hypothetical protein